MAALPFTAAQAAQKCSSAPRHLWEVFTAAQAAQKFVSSALNPAQAFTAAQAAQKTLEQTAQKYG